MKSKRIPNPLQEWAAGFIKANIYFIQEYLEAPTRRGLTLRYIKRKESDLSAYWCLDSPPPTVSIIDYRFNFENGKIGDSTREHCEDLSKPIDYIKSKWQWAVRDDYGNVVLSKKIHEEISLSPCICEISDELKRRKDLLPMIRDTVALKWKIEKENL